MSTYMPVSEIIKIARKNIKAKFPKYKFSITKDGGSYTSSINIALMSADFDAVDVEKQKAKLLDKTNPYNPTNMTEERATELAEDTAKYCQLNQYTLLDGYDKADGSCNGGCLTKEAFEVMQEVVKIAYEHHYDNSDAMTDYFDTNFYLHVAIGKWDKPYVKKAA